MADSLKIDNLLLGTQQTVAPTGKVTPAEGRLSSSGAHAPSFAEALRQAEQACSGVVKFSAHAQTRMLSRQIVLGPAEMERIEGAVHKAATKGARESVVLVDDTAFVVSIANRTVITVVDKEHLKQNVFTNIDSVVIA